MPAAVWEPQAASGEGRLAKELHFDQTVFYNGQLCQPEVGFQAELDVASIDLGEGEGFYINCLSLDLPRDGEFFEP